MVVRWVDAVLGVVKLRLELVGCLQLFLFPRKDDTVGVLEQQLQLVLIKLGSVFSELGAGR